MFKDYMIQGPNKDGNFNIIFPIKFEVTTGVSKVFEHIQPSLTYEEIKENGLKKITKDEHIGELFKFLKGATNRLETSKNKLLTETDSNEILKLNEAVDKATAEIARAKKCIKFIEAE